MLTVLLAARAGNAPELLETNRSKDQAKELSIKSGTGTVAKDKPDMSEDNQ